MGLSHKKIGFLIIISIAFFQSISFAMGQPTDYFILPSNGQSANAFHMVVIGDSIAWGNGLNEEHKYYYQVADWLQKELNQPVEVTVYAHSGATIVNKNGQNGKTLNANLNSWYPTLTDQAYNINNPADVDLILVSGGINDVDINEILSIYTSSDDIRQRSDAIRYSMRNLLSYLLTKNAKAKIIVTNYYPIVSLDTDAYTLSTLYSAIVIINPKGNPFTKITDFLNVRSRLKENSYAFSGNSLTSLNQAVKDANNGGNRIALAMVEFKDSNCYAASDPWLWKLIGPIKTDDEFYEKRAILCDPIDITNILDKDNYINYINAIGHPNVNGANEYTRAIKQAITSRGLDWLKPNDVTDQKTNSGNSGIGNNGNNAGGNMGPFDLSQLGKLLSPLTGIFQNMSSLTSTLPLYIIAIVIALIIGVGLIRRSLWDFIMNAVSGLVVIYLSSLYLGIGIAITTPTLLVCAIGGFPGAIILIALKYFYGITF